MPRSVEHVPIVLEQVSEDEIAELAYELWQERGSPHGSPDEDWLEAENWLLGVKSQE
jgi:hypothetical protein